jgi:hypothetical protein
MSARKNDLFAKSDLNGRRPPPKGYADAHFPRDRNVPRLQIDQQFLPVLGVSRRSNSRSLQTVNEECETFQASRRLPEKTKSTILSTQSCESTLAVCSPGSLLENG